MQPAIRGHSEFLRKQQRDGEIHQQKNGKNEANQRNQVHVFFDLPQLLAGLDVEKRHDEEGGGKQQHEDVLHRGSPCPAKDCSATNDSAKNNTGGAAARASKGIPK
jgi:hypothetical protein